MAIKPVSGKIESQEINDNFSYLDSEKRGMEKINPEDLSEDTLSLVTGDGEINLLTIPQDNSVSMPKFEPSLRKDINDLFNAFVEQDDFIPLELFVASKVKQGGVTSSGTTNSLTRTHIEIDVYPGKEYYVTIPESDYLRLRSISSWNDNTFVEWNQQDNVFSGNSFTVPASANKVIVSFCKVNTGANLSIQETVSELVSIFELVYKENNLIKSIKQGGITSDGFTDSTNRTRTDIISVKERTNHILKLNSDNVRIRTIATYQNGNLKEYLHLDLESFVLTEYKFVTKTDVDGVAVSFAKIDTNQNLTPQETLNAKPSLREAYK